MMGGCAAARAGMTRSGWRSIQYLYFHPASRKMQSQVPRIVVLGSGGTIAGTAREAGDNVGYSAAQLGVEQLIAAVPALAGVPLETEQVAQIDSKDMDFAVWHALAAAVARHLARPEVSAVVVTHGTDTLEETAYFLQRVLAPTKPVVMVAAMRPATALLADGPQNLLDAVTVAREPGARGVVAVLAGRVHGSFDLRKVHAYRLDAFDSGDAGVVAEVEEGRVRRHRDWPGGKPIGLQALPLEMGAWPVVEIVTSHAGSSARVVEALRAAGVDGLVVAATGNGSVHQALESALLAAQEAGVAVLRATRTLGGSLIDAQPPVLPSAGALTPVQARIELILRLLGQRESSR
jgi:L-asparaginase